MTHNGDAGVTDAAGPGAARGTATTPSALAPRGCAGALSEAYDVALLDLDGVVYVGSAVVPGAAVNGSRQATVASADVIRPDCRIFVAPHND